VRGRHGSRGWLAHVARMAGGGGDVRHAAIRALPTKQSKTGSSGFSIWRFRILNFSPRDVTVIANTCLQQCYMQAQKPYKIYGYLAPDVVHFISAKELITYVWFRRNHSHNW